MRAEDRVTAWEAGRDAALALIENAIGLDALAAALKVDAPSSAQRRKQIAAMVAARPDTGESPAVKSARLSRARREIRDAELARELAVHISNGKTTEQTRLVMKIGVVRSQRVRALAVRMGLLAPRSSSGANRR